jgi:hypothetical protein
VTLAGHGDVTNLSTGTISGNKDGLVITGVANVANAGTITSATRYGVRLNAGGGISNASTGRIAGHSKAVSIGNAAGSVYNAGKIASDNKLAMVLSAGGSVTNAASGLIGGLFGGVYIFQGAATVSNAGMIAGNAGDAVYLGSGFANRLIDIPGAEFQGKVDGGNEDGATASSVLELASGASIGVLSGLGSQFTHFSQMVVDTGANWLLAGVNAPQGISLTNAGTLSVVGDLTDTTAPVVNNGLIRLTSGTVTLGALSGTGTMEVGAGGYLAVSGVIPASESVVVAAGGRANINGTITNAGYVHNLNVDPNNVALTNLSTGTIIGGVTGVDISAAGGTVENAGSVAGDVWFGVYLSNGGAVTNHGSGVISAFMRGCS